MSDRCADDDLKTIERVLRELNPQDMVDGREAVRAVALAIHGALFPDAVIHPTPDRERVSVSGSEYQRIWRGQTAPQGIAFGYLAAEGEHADVYSDSSAAAGHYVQRKFIGDTSQKIVDLAKIYRIPQPK